MHFLDIIVVAAIALALFGPKALQSMARSAGRQAGQAKNLKDKVMAELPVEDIVSVTDHIPQVPLNSRQAVRMLLTSDEPQKKEPETTKSEQTSEAPGKVES